MTNRTGNGLRWLLVAACAFLFYWPNAFGFNKDGSARLAGGFNDNVDLLPEGSIDKESSIFGRATIPLWFDWKTSRNDMFYVSLLNDDVLHLGAGDSSAILLRASPGFRFYSMNRRIEADISVALTSNTAFDGTEPQDDGRTRNVRNARPFRDPGPRGTDVSASSATYFSNEIHMWGLYDFGHFRLGPALRWMQTDFSKVPQEDTLVIVSGRAEVPFTPTLEGKFEFGFASNDSSITPLGYSGPMLAASLHWTLSSGINLHAGYDYSFRDFEDPSTREDRLHGLRLGLETGISSNSKFEFEYERISDDSTSGGAEFTANVVTAGVRWELF